MDVKIKLTGAKEIDAVLRGLPLQLNHKVLQAAHTSAAKALVQAEKLAAPEGPTGKLIDSIGVVKVPFARAGSIGEINVGPRRGRYKGNAGHLVEYGTKARRLRGEGKYSAGTNRGRMPKRPFAAPSWVKTKGQVLGSIRNEIGKKLYAFMKRTIRG